MILIWLRDRRPLEIKKALSVTLVAGGTCLVGIFSCPEVTDKVFFVSRGLAVYDGGTNQNWGVGFVEDGCGFLEIKILFLLLLKIFSEGER